ncbi:unnamed protein product [Orchesella dallaii]|uniref:Uncharacterized protein n=1 Tax=Orchesella dallaii TaxID=48710 RepID=A0ABP1QC84_9HEXA
MMFKNPLPFVLLMVSAARHSDEAPQWPSDEPDESPFRVVSLKAELTLEQAKHECNLFEATLLNPVNPEQTRPFAFWLVMNVPRLTFLEVWTDNIPGQNPPTGQGTVTQVDVDLLEFTYISRFAPTSTRFFSVCLKRGA